MKIEYGGKLLAIVFRKTEWKDGLTFLTEDGDYIQVGLWQYNKGQTLKAHKHIENIRQIDKTQEAVYVVAGKVLVYIYDSEDIIASVVLSKNDLCILLDGGHGYEILSNGTQVLEIKNGPFNGVEKDKQLYG